MTNTLKANEYYKKGQFYKAIEMHEKTLKANPDDALAYQGLAQCFLQIKRFDQAYYAGKKALELDQELKIPLIVLGAVYLKKNQLNDAEMIVEKALSLDPDLEEAYFLLGTLYLMRGQIQGSISAFRKAVELNPQYWKAHYNLGLVYNKQASYAEALNEFSLAFKISPSIKTGPVMLAEHLYVHSIWYIIGMAALGFIAIEINSIFALPLVIVPAALFFIVGYVFLQAKNYINSVGSVLIGILIIALYLLYLYGIPLIAP